MLTPEQFKEQSESLSAIVDRQIAVTSASGLDEARVKELTEERTRLTEQSLRVLVMGRFSSGKSTFLNAMMGKMLLPAKATPTTAVIGEICYAENPSATMFPKKGKYKGGNEAFTIDVSELDKYITIDNEETKEKAKQETVFEKVVIKYPLDVCKIGVDFVDSPGLDDPTCHDKITEEYLPSADAIVYCMNVQMAFSAFDKTIIEQLRSRGYKSIIFVLTYFDMLEQNDFMTGKNEADDTKKHYTKILKEYTDLGEEGIFFVGSLPALMGKIKNDSNMLASSHLPEMEKKLEQILFNERGRMKLLKSIYTLKKANKETSRYLTDSIDLQMQDKGQLASKIKEAQGNLDQAQKKANLISENFRSGTYTIIDSTKDKTRAYFLTEILPNVEKWTMEFKPAEGREVKLLHINKTGKVFSQDCMKYIQTKIENSICSWCQDELVPNSILPKLRILVEQQGESLKAYENDLKNIRGNLSLSIEANGPEIGTANRILSTIGGFLIGNGIGAFYGGMLGWESLMPMLIANIVAGLGLGVVSLFTPVGAIAFAGAVVAATIAGGTLTLWNVEVKLKEKIGEKVKKELSNQQEAIVSSVSNGIKEIIDKINEAVEEAMNNPVAEYQRLLDEAQTSTNTERSVIDKRIANMKAMRKDNDVISDDVDALEHEINLNR